MKHGEFSTKKATALACQREHVMGGSLIQGARNMKMHYQTYCEHLRWLGDHHADPVFPELSDHDHNDVMLLPKFGYKSVDELRSDLVAHYHATGRLSKFRGTNDELRTLINLAGLDAIVVGDRPYVHWKHVQNQLT